MSAAFEPVACFLVGPPPARPSVYPQDEGIIHTRIHTCAHVTWNRAAQLGRTDLEAPTIMTKALFTFHMRSIAWFTLSPRTVTLKQGHFVFFLRDGPRSTSKCGNLPVLTLSVGGTIRIRWSSERGSPSCWLLAVSSVFA